MDYATIFFDGDDIDSLCLEHLPETSDFERTVDSETGLVQQKLVFRNVRITFTEASAASRAEIVQGAIKFVQAVSTAASRSDRSMLEKRLRSCSVVIGCAIEPGFDADGEVGGLLTLIIDANQAILFARDTFFNSAGSPIARGIEGFH